MNCLPFIPSCEEKRIILGHLMMSKARTYHLRSHNRPWRTVKFIIHLMNEQAKKNIEE